MYQRLICYALTECVTELGCGWVNANGVQDIQQLTEGVAAPGN